jgi:DNA-binding response OmpR family regulator
MQEYARAYVSAEEPNRSPRARILVVDDSAASRSSILDMLQQLEECDVHAVSSGTEALRAIQKGGYSLVLCDYEMPDMSGLHVLRFIRQRHGQLELPVLMLTGRDDSDVKVRAFRAGASDYISKLAEPEELLARVRTQIKLLDGHRRLVEERLRRAEGQKFEAIGHLTEALAHELNTPAQYIGDNLSFLSESFGALLQLTAALRANPQLPREIAQLMVEIDGEFLNAEVPRCIAESQQGITQMAQVVAVLREFGRRGAEEATPQDLNELVRSAAAVTRGQWHQVADMELELDPELPQVLCVGALIKQVVLYAIMSAVKALMPADGIQRTRGRLALHTRRQGTDWALIEVIDSGPGLPSGVLDTVLDPVLGSQQLQGVAHALAHIRSVIVGQHGGTLDVHSEPRSGTCVRMGLPLSA